MTSSTRNYQTGPKPALILFWLVYLLAAVSWPHHAFAQNQDDATAPALLTAIDNASAIRMPADFNRVEFYLITVDVGNQVWDNFGHTALRMVDENSGTDIVFNWGLFDASVGYVRFAANFALGIMEYQLGVSPPHWELGRYQAEARTVWQDRLVLTTAQKQRLYQRLAWNLRQENLVYDYDYFFDNCTTRVRDYLDEALGGSIAERSRTFSPNTFRDEVQSHYASLPLIAFSLDVLMNERIDRRMSQWEQMFLPAQLRNQLNRLGLLDRSEVLAQFTPPAPGIDPYYVVALLLLPLLLLLLSVRRASIAAFSSQPGFTLRASALSYRIMGLVGMLVVLFSGIYGILMTFGWLFSSHLDTHANINLLLFWPTDLLGLFVTLKWFLFGAAPAVSRTRHQLVVFYMFLHMAAALVYVIVGLTGLSGQSTGSLMLFVVPVLMLFALIVSLVGLRPVRSVHFDW
ncbi:MAG: DUF4105 domain-containing protein [Pseudohongiella sp.]|nr:DUF4105 domain-containing protein [Pseudohongiella sp.]